MTLGNENIGASFWWGNINAKGLKCQVVDVILEVYLQEF